MIESIIQYFETIPSLHRSIILIGGISFFWILEGVIPLFNFNYKKVKHASTNLFFTLTTILINFIFAFILLEASDWTVKNQFGIINWIPETNLLIYVLLGIILLDFFGAYLAHYTEHKVKVLWMIHLVHHTDHEVDTTTANRHHPIESAIRFTFTLLGIIIVGAPIGVIMLYQSLSVIATQFTHANIKMNKKVDQVLSWVFVSPDMHKIHHHHVLPYTDSNYGNIFSIFDRLFGTYMKMDREKLIYGVDTFPDEKENSRIISLLKQPFHKYRKPTTEIKTK